MNECDHIIGVSFYNEELIRLSEKNNYIPKEHWIDYFKFCPYCGIKLNEN